MMYLLVVTYLSTTNVVSTKTYDMASYAECSKQANAVNMQVKAGKVTTTCWKKFGG